MWLRIANFILKNRVSLLILLLVLTVFMGYQGTKAELSYTFSKVVPDTDEDIIYFKKFKALFGQDDNVVVLGVEDEKLFELENFQKWQKLLYDLEKIKFENTKKIENLGDSVDAVTGVIGLGKLPYIHKNQEIKKFEGKPIFPKQVQTQDELDSLLEFTYQIGFYKNQLINPENKASLALITFLPTITSTAYNHQTVTKISELGDNFTQETGIEIHYVGLPFLRVAISNKVKGEMVIFLSLSIAITAIFIFVFFRSFTPVVVSLTLISIVIVWTIGILGTLGYEITILTALLPPILVVIGIPNCVYFITKYHQQCNEKKNKIDAIKMVVKKIGIVTLITNTTTAIGFLVLVSTGIGILSEFGLAAGITIFATFFISILILPIVFSYLPMPEGRRTKHLNQGLINATLTKFDYVIENYRPMIYLFTTLIVISSVVGLTKIKANSFMVDDLPNDSKEKKDIAFIEENFKGTMPLEIVVDTGKPKAYRKPQTLEKIEQIENYVDSSAHLSSAVSLVTFIKAANQAYFNQSEQSFNLPDKRTGAYVLRYLKGQDDPTSISAAFVDTTQQMLRVSLKVADIGSLRLDSLVRTSLQPELDSIFSDSTMSARVTGTTPIFLKGNSYLIENLKWSLLLACVLVAIIIGALFQNIRVMMIAIIPNLIPLLVTAGLMGFFGIPLKPSTALVFSIAFGIAVDDSLHFLARFRQELLAWDFDRHKAIDISLRETGKSMIYTSIILFAGFIIFAFSSFGGTVALGLLTSITLLVAMFTNLILLPALLLTFNANIRRSNHPPIEE
ncbi:efflux RND transporter permease subunit [Bernardetia sp.]|uniref:efflux RND transporter permease subunit n=1 Tax=Bernardetia sp. TaxID=1937974 RepID=UPI0025C34821|nr:efflux RND transporter permease subunit [Bernardetia sp.]